MNSLFFSQGKTAAEALNFQKKDKIKKTTPRESNPPPRSGGQKVPVPELQEATEQYSGGPLRLEPYKRLRRWESEDNAVLRDRAMRRLKKLLTMTKPRTKFKRTKFREKVVG